MAGRHHARGAAGPVRRAAADGSGAAARHDGRSDLPGSNAGAGGLETPARNREHVLARHRAPKFLNVECAASLQEEINLERGRPAPRSVGTWTGAVRSAGARALLGGRAVSEPARSPAGAGLVEIDPFRWELPRTGAMRVPGRVFANRTLLDKMLADRT